MQIVIKQLDQTLIAYQAMIQRVGERDAARAFSAALNHETSKSFTAVKRALQGQTGIPKGTISASTSFKKASSKNLVAVIEGRGRALPLKLFGARQFSYGVSAKPWGRKQKFQGSFIIKSYDGNVFHRTSRKRGPLETMFGPSIPKELIKDDALSAFEGTGNAVLKRALEHELPRVMKL
ncbi:MAG: hypothetical protein RL268_1880 [Pseudomonadota bacterium]|jgi:hypothetical protein